MNGGSLKKNGGSLKKNGAGLPIKSEITIDVGNIATTADKTLNK